jgi:hypothetical protein
VVKEKKTWLLLLLFAMRALSSICVCVDIGIVVGCSFATTKKGTHDAFDEMME